MMQAAAKRSGKWNPCCVWGIWMWCCGSRRLLHAYDWTTTLHLHIPEKLHTCAWRRSKWDKNRTGSCLSHGRSSSLLIPHEGKWLNTPEYFFIELAVHKLACLLHARWCCTICVEKGCLCLFTCWDYVHVLVRAFDLDCVWMWFDTLES